MNGTTLTDLQFPSHLFVVTLSKMPLLLQCYMQTVAFSNDFLEIAPVNSLMLLQIQKLLKPQEHC